MVRGHAQQFSNDTVASRVFADPTGMVRALATEPLSTLIPLWEQAGAELPPISRVPGTGLTAFVEVVNRYTVAQIVLPAPRKTGDPTAIAIIGRGDLGAGAKLTTTAYYTLDLAWKPPGPPRFDIFTLTGPDARVRVGEGPLPDVSWFAMHVFDLYQGRTPAPATGVAALPFWYWWFAFDGPSAFELFNMARSDTDRVEAIRKAPILLSPEIGMAVQAYSGSAYADKLREIRDNIRRDKNMGETWKAAIMAIVNAKHGAPLATNILMALPLVEEGGEHGALTKQQAYELEASLRGTLAGLGVDAHENSMRAHALHVASVEAATPVKKSRPDIDEEPLLFLDQTDLPDHHPIEENETFASTDEIFLAHGGLRAGYVVWAAGASSAMAELIDLRWEFRTPLGAGYFMAAYAHALGEGYAPVPAPNIGDQCLAFGDDSGHVPRTQLIAVRVGRVVARIKVTEGTGAASARQMLHAQMLYPLAGRAAKRAHIAQVRYWLKVEYPTNSIAALVHAPHPDVARLLPKYPLLALGELPEAIRMRAEDRRKELDEDIAEKFPSDDPHHVDVNKRAAAKVAANKEIEKYKTAADTLANFQAQLRAHRYAAYRDAMLALTRTLLASDMGNPRINAAVAAEIVAEVRNIDPDPVWAQLDAICRSRA